MVGLLSPGPDLVLVTALSLNKGRKSAAWAALGIATGVGVWVLAAAAGLSTLIAEAPGLWDGIRLVGGGLLIYLGSRSLSACIRGRPVQGHREANVSSAGPYLLGLATNLANPSAAVVLVGLVAALADGVPEQGKLMSLVMGMPLMAALWFTAVALMLSHEAVRDRMASHQRVLDGLTGVAFAGIGILLIQTVSPA